MKENISITILAKNSSETIAATLLSTKGFNEVLVVDTGSTDDTVAICQQFLHVTIAHTSFIGFGPTHNTASSLALNDWILSLDSDEILTDDLRQEILSLSLEKDTVYSIQRHNYFNRKRMTTCSGWDPDWVCRLYNKQSCSFSLDQVHEKLLCSHLKKRKLQHPMIHTPYRAISDLLQKMQTYSTLFAKQKADLKSSSVWNALFHGWMAFIKSYFLKRGILQGAEGLVLSLYNAHTTWYKYLKRTNMLKK
ncbi:MAG: glycosyltransferase family 2 protein [Chlamydiae bacterium]|nr:glycosyltransferase family 2 protein [Chlamydiota bacterium]